MIRASIAAFATLLAFSASAQQADTTEEFRPVLKAQATVNGPTVLVGDLVENAGALAKVAIFRAPDLGFTGTVPAQAVAEAVRNRALADIDTAGLTEVSVTRAARAIHAKDISDAIVRALAVQFNFGNPNDITITFDRDLQTVYVEPNAIGQPRVAHIGLDRGGRFDASLEMPTGNGKHGLLRIAGRAQVTAEVLTIARTLERGAVIKDSDVVLERRPRAEVGREALTDRSQVVGLSLRVPKQAGNMLRAAELARPDTIARNEVVMLIYEVPGVTLSVRGKAMEGGAEGDVISVLNEQSKRTLQGVIAGPGRVVITTQGNRIVANAALPGQN